MEKDIQTGSLVEEIEHQVDEKIKALEEDYRLQRDLLISGFQKEAQEEANVYLEQELAELRTTVLQSESQSKWKIKKDLFVRRNEMVDELFETVASNLKDYTKTPAYRTWIEQALEKVFAGLDRSESYQLTVKPSDLDLFTKIMAQRKETVTLHTDEEIFVGGFILSNPRKLLQIDKTLDYQIRVQKEWFFTHSGLDF